VLCDQPASEQRGPQWLYPAAAAAPDPVVDAVTRKPKAAAPRATAVKGAAPKPGKKAHP
jgi:hypothetical protein